MPISHFLLMLLFAFGLGVFFSVLSQRDLKQQLRVFLQVFLGLVLGGLVLAWIMYAIPSGPPGSP
ncbi:MAG: hypothetical protein AAGD01_02785 [Acidobacteriota bacterium]